MNIARLIFAIVLLVLGLAVLWQKMIPFIDVFAWAAVGFMLIVAAILVSPWKPWRAQ